MDDGTPCSVCEKIGDTSPGARVMCALCRNFQHKTCDNLYGANYSERPRDIKHKVASGGFLTIWHVSDINKGRRSELRIHDADTM